MASLFLSPWAFFLYGITLVIVGGFEMAIAPARLAQAQRWSLMLVALPFLVLLTGRWRRWRGWDSRWIALSMAFALAPLLLWQMRQAMEGDSPRRWQGVVVGQVRGIEADSIDLEGHWIHGESELIPKRQRLRLNLHRFSHEELKAMTGQGSQWVGEWVACRVVLKVPGRASVPGGFDRRLYFLGSEYEGLGTVNDCEKTVVPNRVAVPKATLGWRQRVLGLLATMPAPEARGALQAMILGDKAALTDKVHSDFRRTGLYHLLVVSGSNLGLLALIFYALTIGLVSMHSRSLKYFDRRIVARLVALVLMALYLYLVGPQPPLVRAFALALLIFIVLSLRRHFQPLHGFLVVTALLLLYFPFLTFSISFQLTLSATLAVVLCGDATYRWLGQCDFMLRLRSQQPQWVQRLLTALILLAAVSFGTFFFTLPVLLTHFHQFSVLSLATNLVYAPILGWLVMPMAFFAALLLPISHWLAYSLMSVATFLMDGVLTHLDWIARWPLGQIASATPPVLLTLGWYVLVLVFLVGPRRRWRKGVLAIGSPVLLILYGAGAAGFSWQNKITAALVDVGDGQALVLEVLQPWRSRRTLIVDTGEPESCDRSLFTYLNHRGIHRVDAVFISHWQQDHAGCLPRLVDEYKVGAVFASYLPLDTAAERHHHQWVPRQPITLLRQGAESQWGPLTVRVESPEEGVLAANINDRSLVLSLKYAGAAKAALWVPGDMEQAVEKRLVALGRAAQAESLPVLVAPHHGSQTSNTAPLLSILRPRQVLISRRRPLSREIIRRYQQLGTTMWRTDTHGTLLMNWQAGKIDVKGYACDLQEKPYNGWGFCLHE